MLKIQSGHASSATALHHYEFDGLGVVDSVGTANGTLLNGASVLAGKLHLDGVDDYVQFHEHIVPTVGDFSVAFFAQEVSPQATFTEIISQGFSGGPGFYVGYDPAHNFRIGDDLFSTGIRFPSDGFLHHYAVTAGSDTRLYIDGTLVATFGSISTTAGGSHTLLGRQFDPFAEFFNGNLDDLWVFSGTLAADEVPALAAANGADDIVLQARLKTQGTKHQVQLQWSPVDGGDINILRNGAVVATTPDDGQTINNLGTLRENSSTRSVKRTQAIALMKSPSWSLVVPSDS